MAAPKNPPKSSEPVKKPVFFVRPKDEASVDAMVDSIVDGITDALIVEVNADRAKRGLPPLIEDRPGR